MKTIYKYEIQCNSVEGSHFEFVLPTPKGAKPLFVGVQHRMTFLWCEVDNEEQMEPLTLKIIGTGHGKVPEGGRYIGSVINGNYVWHVYY